MKNNLENTFKDKLSEFEVPYDPQAWEAVKGQLDAKTTGGGSSSAWKWIAATAVVATIAVTSIVLLNPNETTTAELDNSRAVNTPNKNERATDKVVEKDVVNQSVIENKETNDNTAIISDDKKSDEASTDATINNIDNNPERNTVYQENDAATQESNDNNSGSGDIQATVTPNKFNYIIGNITADEICFGERISITNTGAKNDIVRFELEGEIIELKKANSLVITPENSIVISFIDKNDKIIDSKYIKVNKLPNPDFTYEANIYEKGLPVTISEAYGDYQNIEWTFDGENKKEGKKVKHNFFEKGVHTITLNVTDFNGCENTKEKEVRIENEYNLMAVDAFKPNGSEVKNKAFMPFSLTKRDVRFELIIIDSRDNGIVFTSKDASNPWTGIDERTGEMTDPETVFIWKVQIENPLPNERPVYAGTIVHN